MKQTFNFPYFGAGDASYFKWAEVQVILKKEPTKAQKKQIEKNVPSPIGEIDWKKNIMSASRGFVHGYIAKTYKTKDGLDPEDKENWEDDLFFAANSQVDAFNEDIERWFNEIHNILPIFLTFRAETSESGGTGFSDWHKWSLKQIKTILPYFDDVITYYDHDSEKGVIIGGILLYMIQKKKFKLDNKFVRYLNEVLFVYIDDIDSEHFKKVAKNITSICFIDDMAWEARDLFMNSGKYAESIKLFEKLLLVPVEPSTDSPFYTNILWVLQKDFTGLPINKKLNKLALKKCLPKVHEDPSIFLYACGIYTEMKEYDNAYEMVEKCIPHYHKKFLLKKIKKSMFKDFREKTDVLKLLEVR